MSAIPTVRVHVANSDSGYVTINKEEYDRNTNLYQLFEQTAPKNFLSLSDLRRTLQQVDTLEAVEVLEVEELGRSDGPRKGGLAAIEDRKADFDKVVEPEDEDTSDE